MDTNRPKCRKHSPAPYGPVITSYPQVICSVCGRVGMKSAGRSKAGRAPRILWIHKWDLAAISSDSYGRDWDGHLAAPNPSRQESAGREG